MARTRGRAVLVLSDEQRAMLSELAASRTAPVREVERARVLLKYAQGVSISEIQRTLGVSRPMIYKGIDKVLLKAIDAYCSPEAIIRVVLDNHSAHVSRETMAYLATRPGRFEYVHTPKHGSWLT